MKTVTLPESAAGWRNILNCLPRDCAWSGFWGHFSARHFRASFCIWRSGICCRKNHRPRPLLNRRRCSRGKRRYKESMKKLLEILLIITLLVFAIANIHAQDLDEISKTVVFLRHDFIETVSNEKGTFEVWLKQPNTNSFFPKISSVTGTGFFVAHSNHLFLVTAKHVANDMRFSESDQVVIGMQNGKSVGFPIAILRGANTNDWIHHQKADVSILPLDPPPQLAQTYLQQHFLTSSILEAGTNRPPRDVMLTIVGFPLGMGWGQDTEGDFIPLTRKTRASSGFINSGNLFSLEDPSVQGYSGAPIFDLAESIHTASVFMPSGRRVACFGVVSSTFSDNTGGKMGAIVPTKFILELISGYENSHP